MNKHKTAFILAIIAGGLCLANFAYRYFKDRSFDYVILLAGVFILAIGFSYYFSRPKTKS